jgi:hypothetical protein
VLAVVGHTHGSSDDHAFLISRQQVAVLTLDRGKLRLVVEIGDRLPFGDNAGEFMVAPEQRNG